MRPPWRACSSRGCACARPQGWWICPQWQSTGRRWVPTPRCGPTTASSGSVKRSTRSWRPRWPSRRPGRRRPVLGATRCRLPRSGAPPHASLASWRPRPRSRPRMPPRRRPWPPGTRRPAGKRRRGGGCGDASPPKPGAPQRRAAKERAAAAGGRRISGFPPGPDRRLAQAEAALGKARQAAAAATPAPGRRANVTDSDSRIMKTRRGYIHGYNAQVAADANQIVVAQMVSQDANDVALLAPMLKLLEDSITAGAISDALRKILADAGYWSDDNARLEGDLLIATLKDWKQRKAAREAGTTTGEPPEDASTLEAMEHRLRTAEGAAAYAKRSSTVEPGVANHKATHNCPAFRRRGLSAVRAEWSFMNLSHNMGKLFDHWTPGSPRPPPPTPPPPSPPPPGEELPRPGSGRMRPSRDRRGRSLTRVGPLGACQGKCCHGLPKPRSGGNHILRHPAITLIFSAPLPGPSLPVGPNCS